MTVDNKIIDLSLDNDLYIPTQQYQYQPAHTLQQDISTLYKSQCMYDIILNDKDNNIICTAHACILIGKSQYWTQYLNQHTHTISTLPYTITISSYIQSSVLCTVIKYMYTSKLDLSIILNTTPDQSPSLEPLSPMSMSNDEKLDSDATYRQWQQLMELSNCTDIIQQLVELAALYELHGLHKQLVTRLSLSNNTIDTITINNTHNTDDKNILSMNRLLYGEHNATMFTTTVTVQNKQYHIDPVLFAARSSYFNKMFTSSFAESERHNTIELICMNSYEFELVRTYVYTDTLYTHNWLKQINSRQSTPQYNKSLGHVNNTTLKTIYQYIQLLNLCKYLGMHQLHELVQTDMIKQLLDVQTCCLLWIICSSTDIADNTVIADIVADSCLTYFQHHFMECSYSSAFVHLPQHLLKQALDSGCVDASFDEMCTQLFKWAYYNCKNNTSEHEIQLLLRQLLPPTTLFNQRCKRRIMGQRDEILERILSSMGLI